MVKGEIRRVGVIDEDWLAEIIARYKDTDGFTANQMTKNVYNAMIKAEGKRLYDEIIRTSKRLRHGKPIYLIGVTNNKGTSITKLLRDGYELAARLTNQPLLGYWVHKIDGPYLDAVIATQFIKEAEAIQEGKKNGQRGIFRLWPDGISRSILFD